MSQLSPFGKGPADVEETARVIKVEGTTTKVQLEVNSACGDCGSSGFCHPASGSKPLVEVTNEIHASEGDIISLEVAPTSRISSSLIVFGLPILMLGVGALTGNLLGAASEDSAVVGAIAGLASGLLLVRIINSLAKSSTNIRPRAKRIISRYSSQR